MTPGDPLLYFIGVHHGYGCPLWDLGIKGDLLPSGDPMRDVPATVVYRLGQIDLRAQGVFRPEAERDLLYGGWPGTGICAVFNAERETIGQGYGQFRPSIRVY